MTAMLKGTLVLAAFITLLSAAVFAQEVPEVKKINARPVETPSPLAEPYDKADVKTMAAKCVNLDTEAGSVEIELYPEYAPESVRNFLNLTALGYFDTTVFGRVVPGFVIQGGNIWSRNGGITSSEMAARVRRKLVDEPNKILHERGVVSMARGDEPNSASTSFFILVDKATHLDGKFAAFGRVTRGMEAVEAINKAPVIEEKPEKPVRIRKATIIACTSPAG